MAITPDVRDHLAKLPAGTKVRIKLSDGDEVSGIYRGVEDGEVQIGNAAAADAEDTVTAALAVDKVETVLLDVSTSGPE